MRRFLLDRAAASAAEFALVLPAALLLLFGAIDVGRYVWQLNEYEKAVQLGARYAVATAVVPRPLDRWDFHGVACSDGTTLGFGDTICAEAMRTVQCTSAECICLAGSGECVCPTNSCPSSSNANYNSGAFNNLLSRMRVASKRITAGDVTVEYAGSGLGYVGDPATTIDSAADADNDRDPLPDPSPIVTVKLTNMRYQPLTLTLVGVDVPYPEFSYSLTLEDGDGAVAS